MSLTTLASVTGEALMRREAHAGNCTWWLRHDQGACTECNRIDTLLTILHGQLTTPRRAQ